LFVACSRHHGGNPPGPGYHASTIARQTPVPGTVVRTLTEVEVVFSEAVDGIDASDLTLNGVAATNVFGRFPASMSGSFRSQPPAWCPSHSSRGTALPISLLRPILLPVRRGTLRFDPNATVYGVVLSEIMAVNDSGIHDEDGTLLTGSSSTTRAAKW